MLHYLHAAEKVRNDIADLIAGSVIIRDCSDFFKAPEKYLLGRLWLNFTQSDREENRLGRVSALRRGRLFESTAPTPASEAVT